MPAKIKQFMDRFAGLKERGRWEEHWQELAEVFMPNAADFQQEFSEGDRRNDENYDSVPMQARARLASGIDSLTKDKTTSWFGVRAADKALNDDDDAKRWLFDVQERMYAAIYSRKANFVQRSGQADNSLATFGTASLFVGANRNRNGLMFQTSHLSDTYIAEDADGVVDTQYTRLKMTPRQAVQKFGEERLSDETREALSDEKGRNTKRDFIWAVEPREERDIGRVGNRDMQFVSVVFEPKAEHIVSESGFKSFPFAVPRWETTEKSVYGRSPAMIALPDALMANEQAKTLIVAGQKAVDPPMWAFDDGVIGTPRTYPGGMSYVDGEAAREMGGRPPLGAFDFGKNIPFGREMLNDTRTQIWQVFFRDVLQLPIEGPEMTATEILARKEEFIRTIGPVFGRLESDYIGHIVERVFEVMQDNGQFPKPPDILIGADVQFEFRSPIQAARRQAQAYGMMRTFELTQPALAFDPTIADNWDLNKFARDVPEMFGVVPEWIRRIDEVAQLREQRAQQQHAQQMLDDAQQASEVGANLGKVMPQQAAGG